MGALSKLYEITTMDATTSCQHLLHPWTRHCSLASLDMAQASTIGSAKFFALIYIVQLLGKLLRKKEDPKNLKEVKFWKDLLKDYVQTIAFGCSMGTTFFALNCLCRNLLGKFTHWTIAFLPAFFAGFSIFVETPARRNVVIGSYANMALDAVLRNMENTGWLNWSVNQKVLCFMLINAGLMHLMKRGDARQVPHMWFFSPWSSADPSPLKDTKLMYEQWYRSFLKYSMSGVGLQVASLVLSSPHLLTSPLSFLSRLCDKKNLELPMFVGLYVVTYEVIEWWYRHLQQSLDKNANSEKFQKMDLPTAAAVAGFFSGIVFKLKPSTTILNTALISMLQILLAKAVEQKRIPRWPYWELSMLLWNGILYHARLMDFCPNIMVQIMSAVTSTRSDILYKSYLTATKHFAKCA